MGIYLDKKTGLYRYDFQLSGRRYTQRGYGGLRKAQTAENKRRLEVESGCTEPLRSFRDLVNAWLEAGATTKSAHHVYQQMMQIEKAFGHLGHMRPRDITRAHIEPALHRIRKGRKATTANSYRSDIMALFNWAEQIGAVAHSPARGIPKFPEEASSRTPIPTVDLKKLILAADPELAARMIFISQTGCRWVETARLRWFEVSKDSSDRTFAVLTTRKRRGGHEHKRPQPLTATAIDAVERMKGKSKEFVFPGVDGKMSRYTTDKARLTTLCRTLKLPVYGFHQIRHWTGLITAQSAANPKAIADFLGHSTTAATQRYMHWAAPEMWALAERLEQELNIESGPGGVTAGGSTSGIEAKRAVAKGREKP